MRLIIVGILVLTLGIAGLSTYLIKSFQTPEAIEELEKEMKEPTLVQNSFFLRSPSV